MQLHEKLRPKCWADVVGQPAVVAQIERVKGIGGLAGRPWLLWGPSGVGKTSVAWLLAQEVAEDWLIEERDSKDLDAAAIREMEQSSRSRFLGQTGGVAWIINEAQGLKPTVKTQLLTTWDRIPEHVTWICTSMDEPKKDLFGEYVDALASRCQVVPFRGGEDVTLEFALRARKNAQALNLDGKPLEDYIKLVRKCRGNLRQVYQEIEAGRL